MTNNQARLKELGSICRRNGLAKDHPLSIEHDRLMDEERTPAQRIKNWWDLPMAATMWREDARSTER